MRKQNPVRYSSAVGEAWMHCMFKIKYCHKIFDDPLIREAMFQLLEEAAKFYDIPLREVGFDSDHLHFIVDIALYSRPEIAKRLKGYTAKKFLEKFPEIKKKYFWGSGLWNPSYYIGSPRNLESTVKYVMNQKYGWRLSDQATLNQFAVSA
jgi:putative transposase